MKALIAPNLAPTTKDQETPVQDCQKLEAFVKFDVLGKTAANIRHISGLRPPFRKRTCYAANWINGRVAIRHVQRNTKPFDSVDTGMLCHAEQPDVTLAHDANDDWKFSGCVSRVPGKLAKFWRASSVAEQPAPALEGRFGQPTSPHG